MGKDFIHITEDSLYMHVTQFLLHFDDDIYQEAKLKEAYVAEGNQYAIRILDDIVNKKIQILFEETVRLDLRKHQITCLQFQNKKYGQYVINGIPNPLQYYFGDWGSNEFYIRNSFKNGTVSDGIHTIKESVACVILEDGAVMRRFLHELQELAEGKFQWWNNNKCIYLPQTEQFITVKDYIQTYSI